MCYNNCKLGEFPIGGKRKMNLSQMKKELENSVKEALTQALNEGIDIRATYKIDEGIMVVELMQVAERKDDRSSILCYNISFVEETKETSIIAFNRTFLYDGLGVAIVNNEPVAINSKFMADISSVIWSGMAPICAPVSGEDCSVQ